MVVKTAAERIQIIWQMICDHRSRNSSAFYSKTYESVTASHKTGSRAHLNLSLQWTLGKVSRVVVEIEIWMKTPWQLPFQRKYILGRKAKKLSRVADVDVNAWIFGFGEVNTDLERNTEGRCLRFILLKFLSFLLYFTFFGQLSCLSPILFCFCPKVSPKDRSERDLDANGLDIDWSNLAMWDFFISIVNIALTLQSFLIVSFS